MTEPILDLSTLPPRSRVGYTTERGMRHAVAIKAAGYGPDGDRWHSSDSMAPVSSLVIADGDPVLLVPAQTVQTDARLASSHGVADLAALICDGNTEHLHTWPLVAESGYCGQCLTAAERVLAARSPYFDPDAPPAHRWTGAPDDGLAKEVVDAVTADLDAAGILTTTNGGQRILSTVLAIVRRHVAPAPDGDLADVVREHLAAATLYVCTRDASAWGHGTMRLDDFAPAWEDEEVVADLVDLVRDATPVEYAARTLASAADDAASVIAAGDVAESAAIPPGSVGVGEAIAARDALREDPVAWLRERAAEVADRG